MKKKILIVTPRSPFRGIGACAEDRLEGIKWFIQRDYDVTVVVKVLASDLPDVESAQKALGVRIIPVPYTFNAPRSRTASFLRMLKRLAWPPYWDGAAYEYYDPNIRAVVAEEVRTNTPDIAYFDYSYLWPLYGIVAAKGIPIVTRSHNMEPLHFLDEDGRSILNYVRALPKWVSELIVARRSAVVFAITPKEERIYARMGARAVTLPLRGLPAKVKNQVPRDWQDLSEVHLGFTAGAYTVSHNLEALLFIVRDIMPRLAGEKMKYILHFTGSKVPASVTPFLNESIRHAGFVPDMKDFWKTIDIAVIPSLFGAGMQQKVFEPITFGVPTVTSRRPIAGYRFGADAVYFAESADEYVHAIVDLAGRSEKRRKMSEQSVAISSELFSRESIDAILERNLPV